DVWNHRRSHTMTKRPWVARFFAHTSKKTYRSRGLRGPVGPRGDRGRVGLEVLEDRCVPSTVTNLLDSGPGSLRDAIAGTPFRGPVDFADGLTGTITLTSGELAINQDLTVRGPGADRISGNDTSRVFDISEFFTTVSISGLTITHGHSSQPGGGIYA